MKEFDKTAVLPEDALAKARRGQPPQRDDADPAGADFDKTLVLDDELAARRGAAKDRTPR